MVGAGRTRSAGLLAAVVAVLGGACGPDPIPLGTPSEVLWWTDHETGTLADWEGSNPFAGTIWVISGSATTATGPARSGLRSLQATITTRGLGSPVSAAMVQKQGLLPQELYYSAWFYLPAAVRPTNFLILFKLRSRTNANDPATEVEVYDLEIRTNTDGTLSLALFDHMTNSGTPFNAGPAISVGRWFHLEAFLRATQDASGRLDVWMDGVPVLTPKVGVTMPSPYIEFSVGAVSEDMTPTTGSVLVDDAAISTRRLGPSAPFWRGL